MYILFCRIYQWIMKMVAYLLPFRKPKVLEGTDSLRQLANLIQSEGIKQVLIVTGPTVSKLGLMDDLLKGLDENEVKYSIYNRTVANPTSDNVEEAFTLYQEEKCEAIIAFGGGSPMDCAKGVGARVANPQKSLAQMQGLLKVRKKLPPFYAIPTTAGTGSETTVAAVISDAKTHVKYQVNDLVLIPQYAVLKPELTAGLPKKVTSTTGIDALTHAIEAYIGRNNTKETKEMGKKAVKLIFENLYIAYSDGQNLDARLRMLEASNFAGIAFTRAYVGYVHAIAHALGGLYGLPHGLAISIVLPYVLKYYGASVHVQLAELCDAVGISDVGASAHEKADKFIEAIRELNRSMDIPEKLDCIKVSDMDILIGRILKEGNPTYPVPKILLEDDMRSILKSLML